MHLSISFLLFFAAACTTAVVRPVASESKIVTRAPGVYDFTFRNLTGATQGTDFITFTLVDTVVECEAFCDSVTNCTFANSYHDNNGKGGSPQLTCSVYLGCHNATDATNTGGQQEDGPDGPFNFITNSDGLCKEATATEPTGDPEEDQ